MRIALSGAFTALAAVCPAAAAETPHLAVEARPATVIVEPGPQGLRLIELPTLEFLLSINADCADGAPESISVSVADTTETLDAGDLEGHSGIETKLSLPAQQTGPLPVESFCIAPESGETQPATRLVRDAFTAHLSLRCTQDDKPTVIYVTAPLPLELHCENPGSEAQSSDQDDSEPADGPPRY